MHVVFFLLLGAAAVRFVQRHGQEPRLPLVLGLAAALALLYVLGPALGHPSYASRAGTRAAPGASRLSVPAVRRPLWLGSVVTVWAVLVALAPSFSWCAVPLVYTALRTLPSRAAYVLVGLLTAFVVLAQLRLAPRPDLDLVIGPAAVAALATSVFAHMEGQAARQAGLIDDLVRTRRELAATERRAGALAERQRLSMEIHDTLAQSLSSQQMLLQAADLVWDTDPERARAHLRTAESVTGHGLAEARRFVHDLAPADLAAAGGVEEALRALAARESGPALTVRFHAEGTSTPLPDRVQAALLRIAQGALANVREHAGARTAAVTLTRLGDEVVLDIADDGRGFVPGARARPAGVRGHGLPAIRARARQLGGTLTVESAPGDGTVLSVSLPARGPRGTERAATDRARPHPARQPDAAARPDTVLEES
ncbi:sensor histidine kinase [Streptomyces poonensis]|nr:sensor histidine kinase [Streptomyces poonensis]